MLRTPELYVGAGVGLAATTWEQSAFRAGPLTASLPAVTVSEPVVASVLGIIVLGERWKPTLPGGSQLACRLR